MLFDVNALLERLRAVGVTACGIVMAATPLLLWVAWSEAVFFAALIACLLAVVLLGVFLGPDTAPDSDTERTF